LTILRLFTLSLLLAPALLPAQAPRYDAAQLNGARFHQMIRSDIRTQTAGKTSQEQAGRDAALEFTATATESSVALVAWFDSLEIWRMAGGVRYAPDTDGLVGGRYRGELTPLGRYTSEDIPFIPDPLAELAELGGVVGDLFPPLPGELLAPGTAAHLTGGWTITRQKDSVAPGGPIERYRLDGERQRKQTGVINDSLKVEATTVESEKGTVLWSPGRGLLRWERRIRMDVNLPAQGVVNRAVRTSIEQSVLLERSAELAKSGAPIGRP
jgi:hypothetical protein